MTLGTFSIIYTDVKLGKLVIIDEFCSIGFPGDGKPLFIGDKAHIRSHSVIYSGSRFGKGLITGHNVIVREGVKAGDNLQIGSNTILEGDIKIGSNVKIHSGAHIGRGAVIGSNVWIYPNVTLINDPIPPSEIVQGVTIRDNAVIATNSLLYPGVTIGRGSLVAAGSAVKQDVPERKCVAGNPARVVGQRDIFKWKK